MISDVLMYLVLNNDNNQDKTYVVSARVPSIHDMGLGMFGNYLLKSGYIKDTVSTINSLCKSWRDGEVVEQEYILRLCQMLQVSPKG